jgi:hypothetical protein
MTQIIPDAVFPPKQKRYNSSGFLEPRSFGGSRFGVGRQFPVSSGLTRQSRPPALLPVSHLFKVALPFW